MTGFDKNFNSITGLNRAGKSNINDAIDDNKMPDDRDEIEDEGTAPPVKSGYKPNKGKVVKSGFPKKQ